MSLCSVGLTPPGRNRKEKDMARQSPAWLREEEDGADRVGPSVSERGSGSRMSDREREKRGKSGGVGPLGRLRLRHGPVRKRT